MPQPRVHVTGDLLMGIPALSKQPQFAYLIALIICRWTIVETHTAMLFTTLLPNETESASDIYHTFFEQNLRSKVFLVVAKNKLSPELYQKAEAFLERLRKIMRDRNKVAHSLWCWSEDVPDCLCTIDQRFATDDMLTRMKQLVEQPFTYPERAPYGSGAALTAYSKKDFENMLVRMDTFDREGLKLAVEFSKHISPLQISLSDLKQEQT